MIAGWQLHLTILEKMSAAFNTPSIDLFASSIIGRLCIYVSCQSDPSTFPPKGEGFVFFFSGGGGDDATKRH